MAERDDPNAWRGYTALAFVIIVIAVFVQRFVLLPLLVLRLSAGAFASSFEAIAIVGIGGMARLLFARVSRSAPRRESAAADFLVGYPLFGTLAFLVGTVRISPTTMMIPIICGVAGLVVRQRAAIIDSPGRAMSPRASNEGSDGRAIPTQLVNGTDLNIDAGRERPRLWPALFSWPAIAVIVIVFACGLLAVQTPPSTLDELAYHLTIPKSWVAEGRAVDLPLLSHSYFPLGIESADLPLFSLVPDDAGYASHLLHFFAAVAALLVIWRFLARRASPLTALAGTAAIASIPALAVTSGWSLVDWPLTGLCVLLAEAFAGEETDLGALGVALAAGTLTKYTFWPVGAAAILAMLISGHPFRDSVRTLACALVAGLVFPLRNLILTGDPVAPFLSPHAPDVSGYRDSGSIGATVAGYIFDGRFVDEALGITLVALAFLFVVTNDWRHRSRRNVFAGTTLLLATALSLSTPSARILVPYLVVAALFALLSVDRFEARLRRSLLAAMMVAAVLQSLVLVYFMSTTDPFPLLSGRMSDEQYLARSRRSYPAIRWTDQRLTDGSQTLVVGLHELYEFDHRVRGGGNFDGDRMSAYLSAPTVDALAERLRADRFTHVAIFSPSLVPQTAAVSKANERLTRLSPQAAASLQGLVARFATPVARSESVALYKLR
jgi:hypothetical protein